VQATGEGVAPGFLGQPVRTIRDHGSDGDAAAYEQFPLRAWTLLDLKSFDVRE
jgi:hypothetical protein